MACMFNWTPWEIAMAERSICIPNSIAIEFYMESLAVISSSMRQPNHEWAHTHNTPDRNALFAF